MKFINPTFLWALFALAIPIIIHLFHFRRYKRVLFPNTQYLEEIKEQTATRNRLKHLLTLLSRLLALAFLVLAFAQPFLPLQNTAYTGKKTIGVYIDNSNSMNAESDGTLSIEQAKKTAKSIVDAYSGSNKFQLLTNDFEARHQRLFGKEEILKMIDEVTISPNSKKLHDVHLRQKGLMYNTEGEKRLYFVSDFQKQNGRLKIDKDYHYNLVPIIPSSSRNIFIDSCWFNAPIQLKGVPNQLSVRIRNENPNETVSGRYVLTLNSETKSISDFEVEAKSFITDTLNFTYNQTGWINMKMALNDYPITYDDSYYMSVFVEENVNVLCINEQESDKYFKSVFSDLNQIQYNNVHVNAIDYSSLNDYHFIILNQLKTIPTGLSNTLNELVNKGKYVLFTPNVQGSTNSYNQMLSALEAPLILAPQSSTGGRKIINLNLQHSVINDVFDDIPKNVKLPTVSKYFHTECLVKTFPKKYFPLAMRRMFSQPILPKANYILSLRV